VGSLFFNGGKTMNLFTPRANGPAKITMNTLISGCFAGVFSAFVKSRVIGTYSFVSRYDVVAVCGGFLSGVVGVTGCCDSIEAWAAIIIGIISALVYIGFCKLLDKLHIDDPVEASPIHMGAGLWGTIATGLFHNKHGLFYSSDGGKFFGYQILGLICIFLWVAATSSALFLIMKKLGYLRIDRTIEIIGMDIAELGGLSEELYEKMRKE
jgi:ammonium transporter, Amt family